MFSLHAIMAVLLAAATDLGDLGIGWPRILGLTVVAAIVTTAGSLLALFLKEWLLARSFETWKTQRSVEQIHRKYRDPLVLTALELCNRLQFICASYPPDFLSAKHLRCESDAGFDAVQDEYFQHYRLISTVYRLCSFLGWSELYRQDMVFLDAYDGAASRGLDKSIIEIRSDLADGQLNKAKNWHQWRDALIFREEQRAIGESMIREARDKSVVVGYAEFYELFASEDNAGRSKWLHVAGRFFLNPKSSKDFRLIRMQRLIVHLVELVEVLAPNRLRDDHLKARTAFASSVEVKPAYQPYN